MCRNKEIDELNHIITTNRPEFLAIYGRRRVGKTFLIRNYFKEKKHLFLPISGLKDSPMEVQLEMFTKAFMKTFNMEISIGGDFYFQTWKHAFEQLTKSIETQPKNKKIILFFDELPWLVTHKSRFMTMLDYYWNQHWSHDDRIKLIVCGSAASWMLSNIINEKGGLYNRVTQVLKLEPFSLAETKQYLEASGVRYNQQQILEIYLALGGIPHYLNLVKPKLSVIQNIENICFHNGGKLYNEFEKIFESLFNKSHIHEEIIRIIAHHKNGINRSSILEKCKLSHDGGYFTKRLTELKESGFIIKINPDGEKNNSYYKVIDEYSLFYLHWIEPSKTKHSKEGYWLQCSQTTEYKVWAGYAFEAVCFKHLHQIRTGLNIPAGSTGYAWKYTAKKHIKLPGAQIDLLFDRPDNAITICEIKHNDKPYKIDKDYAHKLLNKIEVYKKVTKTDKQIFLALITASGLKPSVYSEEYVCAHTVLKDLFKE